MPARVDTIAFKMLSPEEIKKMSVVKISRAELYDRDGYPLEGGVMDPRLGVIDPGLRCRTCGGTVGDCPGHFGYLELSRPVVHVRFAKHIHYILKSICRGCSKPLAEEEELRTKKVTFKTLVKQQRKKCPHCGEEQEKIKFAKPSTFKEGKHTLDPSEIRERLEKIPDEQLKYLKVKGGRPEWLVITILPIPPVTIRPSITLETGERSEDDLTHKLVDVVRINKRLRENIDIGAPDFIIEDLWELVQYHVSTYFDNELTGIPQARHRSGRALKTLTQRLKTKEGRFRANLAGKRVNFSARTVVSPDPSLNINEVGVPLVIATELTVPEKVTERNIEWLRSLINNAPEWPAANYVLNPAGRKKKVLAENKEEIAKQIEQGWIVERHLMDGDTVVFNRQPSLHRMSLMGHKVRVMPYRTFRFNLSAVTPYNADFDGDEMNLHVPQTEEAMVETEMLMDVYKNIRSPRFGGPIIGLVKDHITGVYMLTRKETEVSREDAYELLLACGVEDPELPKKKTITGKEIFSALLPNDLNMEFKSTYFGSVGGKTGEDNEYDAYVIIKNGKLKTGVIDKRAVAPESGELLDRIHKEYGEEVAKRFLENATRLSIEFLTRYGFSISLSHLDIDQDIKDKINKMIEKAREDVVKYVDEFREGQFEALPGRTVRESLEAAILTRLRNTLNEIEEVIEQVVPHNDASAMARSGARGSMVNITQMIAAVGQETIRGKRPTRGYSKRTLSIFKKGDLGTRSRGFVGHGYKSGLDPYEFFFDAANGREGLMDTSLRTRHSGYMERRLVNAMQDLTIRSDRTVRDSGGNIIQFLAGEDGIDPYKSDKGEFKVERIVERLLGK